MSGKTFLKRRDVFFYLQAGDAQTVVYMRQEKLGGIGLHQVDRVIPVGIYLDKSIIMLLILILVILAYMQVIILINLVVIQFVW